MADDKEMYLEMMRETEKAIHIFIAVQQRCEEMYLNASEPDLVLFPKKEGGNDIPSSSCGPA